MMRFFTFLVVLLFGSTNSFAQYKELGVFFGGCNYQGDLSLKTILIKETNLSVGAVIRYPFHQHFGLRFHYIYGKLSGSDYNSKEQGYIDRGYTFESPLHEVSIMGEFYLRKAVLNNNVGLFRSGRVIPYIALGTAVTLVPGKPVATKVSNLKPDPFPESEDVDNFVSFPIIGGLKYFVSEHFVFAAEIGSRTMFSDYLDGISKSANPNKNDWYIIGGISASWVFGVQTCAHNW